MPKLFPTSQFLRAPWLAGLLLAIALAPVVRGQVMGSISGRTSTVYNMGLLYDFSNGNGTDHVQIISTDGNGLRTVAITSGVHSGYYSYQVTPLTLNGVSVPDEMFMPLTQNGTLGVSQFGGSGIPFTGFTFVADPLGPYLGDKIADLNGNAAFISQNNGGTAGRWIYTNIGETRDFYYGVFDFYYSMTLGTQNFTPNNGNIFWSDQAFLIVRDQQYLRSQTWYVNINFYGDAMTYLGPIPEPSTYAAIFGACALGCAAWKRGQRKVGRVILNAPLRISARAEAAD